MTEFERGSEWRRWDLHVHTAGTQLNDQFGDWDGFIAAVEGQSDVTVLGVTDYFLIDNYEKLRAIKLAGRMRNILLLIPNIEFRINPRNDKLDAVIVATGTRRDDGGMEFTYVAGALEDSRIAGEPIRDSVCRILEGGKDAFQARERRYADIR
jgi:hypothetical protein